MSEAELHILKARMHEGRKAKARRGELILGLPRGYVLKPSGEVALDPDEGVQRVIRLVFTLFEKRRSRLCRRLCLWAPTPRRPAPGSRQTSQWPTLCSRSAKMDGAAPKRTSGVH
nr:hypothetical protein [Mesorhizobium sp.]